MRYQLNKTIIAEAGKNLSTDSYTKAIPAVRTLLSTLPLHSHYMSDALTALKELEDLSRPAAVIEKIIRMPTDDMGSKLDVLLTSMAKPAATKSIPNPAPTKEGYLKALDLVIKQLNYSGLPRSVQKEIKNSLIAHIMKNEKHLLAKERGIFRSSKFSNNTKSMHEAIRMLGENPQEFGLSRHVSSYEKHATAPRKNR